MKRLASILPLVSFAVFASALPRAAAQAQAHRVALVIGNGSYATLPGIPQARNDARDTAAALRRLGFSVIVQTDRSRKEMAQLIRDFGTSLSPSTVALFY